MCTYKKLNTTDKLLFAIPRAYIHISSDVKSIPYSEYTLVLINKRLAKSQQTALDFLQSAGFLTDQGTLNPYFLR